MPPPHYSVSVQVSSLLWMSRQRRGVLPLKPLCLGNMAAAAELRGNQFNSKNFIFPLGTSDVEEQQGVSIPDNTYNKQRRRGSLIVCGCCPSQSSAVIYHHTIISLSKSCVCVEAQSSRREQTPLDPAVSPWRVTGLWSILLALKMEISLLRRGKDLSEIIKI